MKIILDSKTHTYRPDIDGLRAIAVLFVLGYHVFPKSIKGGFIGVDIFFVISGYLISGIILNNLEKDTFTFSDFFKRRIRRIYPVLLSVLITSFVLGWFFLMPKEFYELNKHILGGVGFVANFTLWSDSGYFDSLPELKPLMHLWSLGVEEQFYLIWPLLLWTFWKQKLRLLPIILFILVSSFLINVFFIKSKPETVFYFPITRFWELLVGSILAYYSQKKTFSLSIKTANLLSILGLLFIFIAAGKVNKHSSFPGWWAVLPTLGTAFLISSKNSWINSNVLSLKFLVWIGLISYPLYLWHWPIISFTYYTIGELPYKLDRIGIIVFSFFVSWFSYRFIESPIRFGKSTKIVPSLLMTSILIGIISMAAFLQKGIPARMEKEMAALPKELQEMLDPNYGGYIAANWREHSCFLAKGEDAEQFKKDCMDVNRKPNLFIWGDSHAAALYSGFKLFQSKKDFGIAQYTASACPPILNWQGNINKHCSEINNFIFQKIQEAKPETVILHASWSWNEYDAKAIVNTLDALKKIGIKRIIIMGQSPTWKEKVPSNIISFYKVFGRVPNSYTDFGLIEVNEAANSDKLLSDISAKYNVEFISIFKTLCSDRGCLLSTGDIRNVSSLDQGHLSVSAAEFVIKEVEDKIFIETN